MKLKHTGTKRTEYYEDEEGNSYRCSGGDVPQWERLYGESWESEYQHEDELNEERERIKNEA